MLHELRVWYSRARPTPRERHADCGACPIKQLADRGTHHGPFGKIVKIMP
jgi:hypothetical protein